jgi:hypothetical protein
VSDKGEWARTDTTLIPGDPMTVALIDRVDVTLKDGRKGHGKTVEDAIKNAQAHKAPRAAKELK